MGRRNAIPESLPGATEFSDQPEMQDPLWAVRKLKCQPQWLSILEEQTNLGSRFGRPRVEGSWALAFLAFTVSGRVDVEPWWAETGDEIWVECGFAGRPSYPTTWTRFSELEGVSQAFVDVAGELIKLARVKSDGKVGRDLHVDGSEAETNARLIHDCGPGDPCQRRNGVCLTNCVRGWGIGVIISARSGRDGPEGEPASHEQQEEAVQEG